MDYIKETKRETNVFIITTIIILDEINEMKL